MIYRIFPLKDTFITDIKKNVVPQTGSNFGGSEILDLFKKTGISGSSGFAGSSSISRLLFEWDLSEIAALTASSDAPSTGAQYFLKLFDARHSTTLPTSYDIEIVPLSRSWDEGAGIDNDRFLDKGVANWDKSQTSVWWTTAGGDYISAPSSSYHFDQGNENVEVEITDLVGAWLTGGLDNYGIMVKLTATEETDSNDYYVKKFHGRSTSYLDKRPVIEMRWDDSKKDDRGVFLFDYSSSLFLYNKKRGQLTDITGIGTGNDVINVTIADASGTIMSVSASHTGITGIYSASVYLATGSYSGSVFYDKWGVDGRTFMTGTFYPENEGATSANTQQQYVASIKNLKKEYDLGEEVRLNLFVRTRNFNPPVVLTGSLALKNTIIEKGYYRIDNATTGEIIIPLGTGSVETTRLSYDENGNYFKLYTNCFAKKEVYKVVFFFELDGELQKLDENIRFRIV